MSSKIQTAITAGVLLGVVLIVIGLLTALVPALSPLGCCACLVPIGAGIYAVRGYVTKSATPVQIADGAILGGIAGAVGGVLYLIIGAPLAYFINAAALEASLAQMRQMGVNIPGAGFALVFLSGIIGVVVDAALGAIGGLVGVPLLEKRKGDGGMPPPPPSFGGTPSGFGGPNV